MKFFRNASPLLLMAVLSSVGLGDDDKKSAFPISTDRPSFSDGPVIVPVGHFQIESGYTFNRAGGTTLQTIPELMARMALSDRFEVRLLNVTYATLGDQARGDGLEDPAIGFKYQVLSGRNTVALVGLSTMPAGAAVFRVNRSQPTAKVAWEYSATTATTLGANLAVSDLGPSEARFTQYTATAYVNEAFTDRTGGFVEWYDLAPTQYAGSNGSFGDVGVTYLLDKATQIDFRVGSGFNQRRDGWYVGAGFSYRF